jgi:hypothetical protein
MQYFNTRAHGNYFSCLQEAKERKELAVSVRKLPDQINKVFKQCIMLKSRKECTVLDYFQLS